MRTDPRPRPVRKDRDHRRRKGLGQHFLIDKAVARRQVELAGIKDTDTVLEVGPGKGVLTDLIQQRAGRVVAIEKDPALLDELRTRAARGGWENVDLVEGDALKVDWPDFERFVSNIPYVISSPLTFRLLEHRFTTAVIMYQREFAQRLIAREGSDYSRLSVNLALRAEARITEIVPREAFHVPPKVESAIVELVPKEPPEITDPVLFQEMLRVLFSQRRKMALKVLRNSDRLGLVQPQIDIADSLIEAGERVDRIPPARLLRLANALAEARQVAR